MNYEISKDFLFATQQDFQAYRRSRALDNWQIRGNILYQGAELIARLVSKGHIIELLQLLNKMSLDPTRKMPSSGWCFEMFKRPDGYLDYDFTKKAWLNKNKDYLGISFSIASPFERFGVATLLSNFQAGGSHEHLAINVYSYYDRLFAKFSTPVYSIEEVPDLEQFLERYMPYIYKEILLRETAMLIKNFDPLPYLEKIIYSNYTYD